MSDASDTAMREASGRAMMHGAALHYVCVLPIPDLWNVLFPHRHKTLTMERSRLAAEASARLVNRVMEVTGRSEQGFTSSVEPGSMDAIVLRKALGLRCDFIIIPGHLHIAGVIRQTHCPVLIVRSDHSVGGVLVATDLSDPSLAAIAVADKEARRTRRRLTALFSVNFTQLAPVGPGSELGAYVFSGSALDAVTDHAHEQLREAMEKVHARGAAVVERGPAADAILRAARKLETHLIVIGVTTRTLLGRLLLGSTAETVVERAPCTVLVVPIHAERVHGAA